MAMSRSFGAMSFTIRSPILMFPLEISSSPARQRKAVVLPQPEGPTSTRNSLSATSMFRLLTASTSPYFLTTFSYATLAMVLSSVSWEYSDFIILLLPCKEMQSEGKFSGGMSDCREVDRYTWIAEDKWMRIRLPYLATCAPRRYPLAPVHQPNPKKNNGSSDQR